MAEDTDMKCDISLIVPNRNHAHKLPRLLDSVLAQQGARVEVVIVDDDSDEPYGELLDGYRSQGLRINFVQGEKRLYTKNARLAGIRAAQAPIVAFADADDALVGTQTLARHWRRMVVEDAQVLHFRSYIAAPDGTLERYFYVADPFAERLEGIDIFSHFLKNDVHGTSAIWNKLFRKDIFLQFIDHATQSSVLRYVEDLYLNSLYLMHAKRYTGSHEVGYAYSYVEKDRIDATERAIYTYAMRNELLPYMQGLGFCEDSRAQYAAYLEHYLSLCVGRLAMALGRQDGNDISDATLQSLLEHTDKDTLLKVLLLGCRLNAEKIVSATRLLRTGRVY